MTDPAVEAARRAFEVMYDVAYFEASLQRGGVASEYVAVAREMAHPIRALYEYFHEYSQGPGDYREGVSEVVRALAPLLYANEEF
ncbi:hypothetical protein [Mycolicibacterium houstonense]|uniref:hypothetical protein n=1 Tax=Mycolicibacterium houstonense TaxID=146021 RepID=UPI000835DF39|nr:hypothetical protein [Mycolicibacterium houstonense]